MHNPVYIYNVLIVVKFAREEICAIKARAVYLIYFLYIWYKKIYT